MGRGGLKAHAQLRWCVRILARFCYTTPLRKPTYPSFRLWQQATPCSVRPPAGFFSSLKPKVKPMQLKT